MEAMRTPQVTAAMEAEVAMRRLAGAAVIGIAFTTACSSSSVTNGSAGDASAPDAGVLAREDDAGVIVCGAPLASGCQDSYLPSGSCPPALASALPGPWCATNPNAGAILGACAGYTVLPETSFTDVSIYFMYAADGGALSAVLQAGSSVACVGGVPGFSIPTSCFPVVGGLLAATFDGPGAAPGCSAFDEDAGAGEAGDAATSGDAGDAGVTGDGGDASVTGDAGDAGAISDAGDAAD
jgi:hypothetical protein